MPEAYEDATYGERIAAVYDDFYAGCEEEAIDLLCELASGGGCWSWALARVASPCRWRSAAWR